MKKVNEVFNLTAAINIITQFGSNSKIIDEVEMGKN